MQKRNVLHSPRLLELKREKRKVFIRKILIFLFGFAVVVAFLTYVSRIERLNISGVEVTGNNIVDTEMLREAAQKQISGKYFWLFPKTNIFFYPKSAIKNELGNQFKRLKDITLNIKDAKVLEISVTERTGKYIWCGQSPNFESQAPIEECYFLDEDGYIFDQAPYFSGEVYFKFYGKAAPGNYFLGENFKGLILFKDRLTEMGLKPVMLYTEGDNIKIFLTKGKTLPIGPEIIFKTDSNLENIAENLKTALETAPLQEEIKSKYSSLQYIDLRFENKVYYKFK